MSSSITYRPAWWVPGPHAQTLWGKFVRRPVPVPIRRERWDTPDGDFLDLYRLDAPQEKEGGAPRVVLLHGLEGSVRSHYAQGLLGEMHSRGWGADLIVFRSCGEELNRSRRFYHSGETSDLAFALERILCEYPSSPIALAGVSLGGNVLLKYLGERGDQVPAQIVAAAAVSVPFDLSRGAKHISKGFSKVYERHFLDSLKRKVRAKLTHFPDLIAAHHIEKLDTIETLFAFDDTITSYVHGFKDAEDYYTQSSSIRYLDSITVDTLLLSAVDDPFLPSDVLNDVRHIAQFNSHLHIEFVEKGGHAGFVSGWNPLRPVYYLERRVGAFLASFLNREGC
jgi:predicted alpha/beta-fold hydrolase